MWPRRGRHHQDEHSPFYNLNVVVLSPTEPSVSLRATLNLPFFRRNVLMLKGSTLVCVADTTGPGAEGSGEEGGGACAAVNRAVKGGRARSSVVRDAPGISSGRGGARAHRTRTRAISSVRASVMPALCSCSPTVTSTACSRLTNRT